MNKVKQHFMLTVASGASVAASIAGGVPANKPNIVFFMVDDMGWQDCSLPFWKDTTALNRIYHTPNMERLATQGMMFTRAYASAVSSPSRVSLMTGMNPAAHRVVNWTLHQESPPDAPSKVLDFPKWNWNGLQPIGANIIQSTEATTLPQLLQKAGYHTIHVGKAHFGSIGTPGAEPKNLGFDVNIAGHAAGGLASYLGEQNFGNKTDGTSSSPFAVPGLEDYWGKDVFVTDVLTEKAIAEMDKARTLNKPFYLYMSHYAIHVPWDKDKKYYDKYRAMGLDDNWAKYASLVEGMDNSLGQLLDYLEQNHLRENTIIIFMSDNGGLNIGRTPSTQVGVKHNYPLNSGKGSAYEGGVRVPLIISAPCVTEQGTQNSSVVEVCDMLPTIMDLAGVSKYKTVQKVDGQNIRWMLEGGVSMKDRSLFWHFPAKWDAEGPGIGTYSAVLRGDLKFIYFYETKKIELYNLKNDIFEIVNQGNNPSMAAIRRSLADELTLFLKKKKAQLPSYKNGEWCSYPNGDKYKPHDAKR